MTASMAFYADGSTTIRLADYGAERTPILMVDGVGHSLHISAFNSVPIADHLAFARELATAATEYVAALERYAANSPTVTAE
ncbi:hypothetical protein J7E87_12040 [Streptomyces sp. ISL-1]|uniref:hypothetical protein n=1 Tax=Streptomyces sp. ISL-1 TaxID=2817657 RepID=UPI001BECEE72|nr:hypothetical protein [Streptomyces sp. ISL-1]MBT2390138.1 hypothetical protein [Streptomyces sp. ISL-1]